jgi:osmotically-inducible protein OsmY
MNRAINDENLNLDQELREEALEILALAPLLDSSQIHVTVQNGIIYLSGFVVNEAMKNLAFDSLQKLKGAKSVCNDLLIHHGHTSIPL